ncbi:hypothetical protein [Hafnia paralvei]|uniref:hypothetical protein n=1 Tax=Hafnia paralvei TaxID=546367 RepID=UPI0027BA74C7|nr:hypothetical protein [Hafnia paralvei]
MTQFKYPHFLLGSVVAGLLVAGEAYATQSAPTPGPSVGHRPVPKLVVEGGAGDASITNTSTYLPVGSTIKLMSVDIDDDEVKGAYCVWYKVNASTSVVIHDPGPADRSCEYTLQRSDIGYKIKVSVTGYSDVDKALAKGYTVNPIDSLPIELLSALSVIPQPFIREIGNDKGVAKDEHMFNPSAGFPSRISYHQGAKGSLYLDNGTGGSALLNEFTVTGLPNGMALSQGSGVVHFTISPSFFPDKFTPPVNKTYSFVLTPKIRGARPIKYEFTLDEFWYYPSVHADGSSIEGTQDDAERLCANTGGVVPTVAQMTSGTKVVSMSSMWGQWSSFRSSGRTAGALWSNEPGLAVVSADGSVGSFDVASKQYIVCVKEMK